MARLLQIGSSVVTFALLAVGCDRSPEANGGPRVIGLKAERTPYPAVANLPVAARASIATAEQFVVVDGDDILHLGRRGDAKTIDVSTGALLRALWRLRGDPLGGRGAATPDAAPLLLASAAVPAGRTMEVVRALWRHGARLAVGGGAPGAAREHPVRMLIWQERGPGHPAANGAIVELGPRGLTLTVPGEDAKSFDACGPSPDTGCLARVLDSAADSGEKSVFLRQYQN